MGRAFEYRRARKEKRWDWMAKTFTRIGKEIAISVKQGGPDPETNPRLRAAIQNAKGSNMPKERVENAIKKAASKEEKDYQEITYEGYGPYGVPVIVECATDNPTRTVANIRMYFNRSGGSLSTSGSLDFMFEKKGVFQIAKENLDMESLELELIDAGAEDIEYEEDDIIVYTGFTEFGQMQKFLEEKQIATINAQVKRIPTVTKELSEEEEENIQKLLDKIEEDDDVQAVYTNIA